MDAQDGESSRHREGRKALTSCSEVLPVMEIIDRVQRAMDGTGRGAEHRHGAEELRGSGPAAP